jgi:hypothetical protein
MPCIGYVDLIDTQEVGRIHSTYTRSDCEKGCLLGAHRTRANENLILTSVPDKSGGKLTAQGRLSSASTKSWATSSWTLR